MAKRAKKGSTRREELSSAATVAETADCASEVAAGASSRGKPDGDRKAAGSARQTASGESPKRSFFDVYKPGQGFHTRVWTAIGSGALVCWFAYFLFEKLGTVSTDQRTAKLWQVIISVAVLAVFGLLGYWVLALNRKVCDFMIATEGEMKKVNWTTRKDIIGSTKVVVIMTMFMGILLFIVDLFFMGFFTSIGVLKGGSFLDTLRELF